MNLEPGIRGTGRDPIRGRFTIQRVSITVFVVDPQPFFCEALAAALGEDDRLQVVGWTTDPDEAARLVPSMKPDVLLCDLELAFDPPADLLRRLGGMTSVIALTRGTEGDAILTAAGAGASGCIGHATGLNALSSIIAESRGGRFLIDPDRLGEALRFAGLAKRQEKPADLSRLTARERQILDLLADGLDNLSIAQRLHVSSHTVRTHVGNVLRKLGVRSRSEAVGIALRGTTPGRVSVLRIEGPPLREQ